jgi:hypothetical protein
LRIINWTPLLHQELAARCCIRCMLIDALIPCN